MTDESVVQKRLRRAKVKFVRDNRRRFLFQDLMLTPIVLTTGVPAMAMNGKNIFVNPEWVEENDEELVVFGLVHEVYHKKMAHHLRRGMRDPKVWNIAADMKIHQHMMAEGYTVPNWAIQPEQWAYALSTEQIYSALRRKAPDGTPGGRGQNGDGEDQFQVIDYPWDGDDGTEGEEDSEPRATQRQPSKSELEGKLGEHRIEQLQQAEAARAAGDTSAFCKYIAGKARESSLDPWEVLRDCIAQARTRDNYSWSRPNNRYAHTGFILPSLYSLSVEHLLFAIDTSGSMACDERLLAKVQAEVDKFLRDSPDLRITIVYCDCSLKGVAEVTSDDVPVKLEFPGGGGTSFLPMFEEAKRIAEVDEFAAMLVLTDMVCCAIDVPDAPPSDAPVFWLDYMAAGNEQWREPILHKFGTHIDVSGYADEKKGGSRWNI